MKLVLNLTLTTRFEGSVFNEPSLLPMKVRKIFRPLLVYLKLLIIRTKQFSRFHFLKTKTVKLYAEVIVLLSIGNIKNFQSIIFRILTRF